MDARYYDPVIGRFYSNDPVGYTARNPMMSFNRYLYVNNNPYKYTDPNGEFLFIGAAIGAVLDVAVQAGVGMSKGGKLWQCIIKCELRPSCCKCCVRFCRYGWD